MLQTGEVEFGDNVLGRSNETCNSVALWEVKYPVFLEFNQHTGTNSQDILASAALIS